ncbi:hypothetical protein C2G38_2095751 [Gigaspora rosea]|uniref:Uncharacterized protein n=1 Tax=Gigaspora rosea TaxID=44941 RepID=A0A397V594_9GLOM|nr:hypothetical protein C2G38_2095751 [Gigaspora rosea]
MKFSFYIVTLFYFILFSVLVYVSSRNFEFYTSFLWFNLFCRPVIIRIYRLKFNLCFFSIFSSTFCGFLIS